MRVNIANRRYTYSHYVPTDAFHPRNASLSSVDRTNDTLALASKAAKEGAETTRSMAARAGRSSHVPEHYASYHGPTGAKAKYAILPISPGVQTLAARNHDFLSTTISSPRGTTAHRYARRRGERWTPGLPSRYRRAHLRGALT